VNQFAIVFLITTAVTMLLAPRSWAPLPLLAGAGYMTVGQVIEIGPLHFTVIRVLIAIGIIRIIARREWIKGGISSLDWLLFAWAVWALISSFFHEDPSSAFISRLGLIYNACGIYVLLRVLCQTSEDVIRLCGLTAILLVPIAVEMVYEKATYYNLFSVFGGVPAEPAIREGKLRAQGPFAHAIIAGTIGAVCLPLMIGLWQLHRKKVAVIGITACMAMIVSSSSSGPILTLMLGTGAMFMWYCRNQMQLVRWLAVLGYILLDLVMKPPAYYVLAKIDLVGGSTGWHRARLLQVAFESLNEWWLAGTDYTRHWMPYGVPFSENHADITNYYLEMGIIGGLPLMFLFIMVLAKGFSFVGQTIRRTNIVQMDVRFIVWTLGAALFAQAASFFSITYFDQSFLFLYLNLAAIASMRYAVVVGSAQEKSLAV
jgi:hypothetical protein